MVSKKRKRARRVIKESDWKSYFGSNLELQKDVELLGPDNFKREVLFLCRSKALMNYFELREQVLNDVLFKPDEFYNSYLGGRISRSQVIKHLDSVELLS